MIPDRPAACRRASAEATVTDSVSIARSRDAAPGRRFRVGGLCLVGALVAAGCSELPTNGPQADQPPPPPTAIGHVQGSGLRSPYVDQTLSLIGVVTGNFVGASDGFFMQDERGADDGDPATSDGIFVRYPRDREPTVRRGDRVRVHGTVAELGRGPNSQTALVDVTVEVLGRAAAEVTVISSAPDDPGHWERYEGMWLRFASPLYVAGNYGLHRYGQLEVSFDRRPRQIGMRMSPHAANAAAQARRTAARMLVLDDARDREYPDSLWFLDPPPNAQQPLRGGSRLDGVEGVLEQRSGYTRLQLTARPAAIEHAPRPPAPELDVDGLRIAHFNVLNYFNGDGRGGGFPTTRGARDADALARQQAKIVAMILGLAPDVASVVELENDGSGPDSAQQQLVDALNAALGAQGDYRAVPVSADAAGDDAIRVGILYRERRLTAVGAPTHLLDGPFADRARPPLAQRFVAVDGGEPFTVVAVHLKSKGGCDDVPADRPADRDQGDGQSCWNRLRTESADVLDTWLRADPAAGRVVLLGDFNASTFEDPMRLLRDRGWHDAIDPALRDGHTYVYRGLGNRLDHALLSPALAGRLAAAAIWHINADEAPLFGYDVDGPLQQYRPDPYRASDHDPLLLILAATR